MYYKILYNFKHFDKILFVTFIISYYHSQKE